MTAKDFEAGMAVKIVSPNDDNDIYTADSAAPDRGGRPCKIWVTGTGNVNIIDASGNTVLISAVPANSMLLDGKILVKRVLATSTTAIGMYAISQ